MLYSILTTTLKVRSRPFSSLNYLFFDIVISIIVFLSYRLLLLSSLLSHHRYGHYHLYIYSFVQLLIHTFAHLYNCSFIYIFLTLNTNQVGLIGTYQWTLRAVPTTWETIVTHQYSPSKTSQTYMFNLNIIILVILVSTYHQDPYVSSHILQVRDGDENKLRK